jgi:hypothetical protein
MSADLESLRSELEGKFDPPVDVMLDPSLLVAESSRNRLSDSPLFEAKTQATLGQTPAQPRVDSLYVPQSFRKLIEIEGGSSATTTTAWNLFRGQAEGATVDAVTESLDSHGVEPYDGWPAFDPKWGAALEVEERTDRLTSMLGEICGFLADGGVLLSRTPVSLNHLRDAGVTTVDIGRAELDAEVRDALLDIGYRESASVCAFGIESASEVAHSLVGDLLGTRGGVLVYRFGG